MGLFKQIFSSYLRENKKKARQKQAALSRVRIYMAQINERLNICSVVKNVRSIETQFNMIFINLDKIMEIENQYPNIMSPTAGELKIQFVKTKDIRIRDYAIAEANLNIEKVKEISKQTSKINLLDKSILFLVEAREFIKSPEYDLDIDNKIAEIKIIIEQVNTNK